MPTRASLAWWVVAALLLVTAAAYWSVGRCEFLNFDDDGYVFAPLVNKGVRTASVIWALTSVHTANWHPVTTLSHMLDCEVFGLRAGPMHWENLGWHLLNSLLVFLVWRALTQTLWRSALVAALFALHPLHVESVAWISSRKDLLSTLGWLLALGAYVRWTRAPSRIGYAAVALCLIAALLAKPMAVTLPCTLLLLDGWPLRRWPAIPARRLVGEKLPLFAIVVAHSAITFIVQYNAGAANYAARIPLGARLGNAVVAYARYLGKTVWPEHLSPLYWHPGYWPVLAVAGAASLLVALSWAAWRTRHDRPWLAFGWLWFLGTLVPAIGIVQVGAQSMADRYTYVPLLGIFTAVAWGAAELAGQLPRRRIAVAGAASLVLLAAALRTRYQVLAWTDSVTLYRRSIAHGEDNPAIRYLLGTALAANRRPEAEVVAEYQRAIALQPDYVNAHTQLSMIALGHQRFDECQAILERNLTFEPRNASLYLNVGAFWVLRGDLGRAMPYLQEALRLAPKAPGIHRELALLYQRLNRLDEARGHFETAVRLDPWNAFVLTDLGLLLAKQGAMSEARAYLERALWIDPTLTPARQALTALTENSGRG
jgi:protein O-mannosyl-transferase